MAVQLPRIQRSEPQAPLQVEGLQVQTRDMVSPASAGFEGIQKGLSTATDAFVTRQLQIDRMALEAVDISSQDLKTQFTNFGKSKLKEISLKTGDTTVDYETYKDEIAKEYNRLMGTVDNYQDGYKKVFSDKLKSANSELQFFAQTQQAEQYVKYETEVLNESAKTNQDSLSNTVQFIDINNPDSFKMVDHYIGTMVNNRVVNARKHGRLAKNEDGSEKVIPIYGVNDKGEKVKVTDVPDWESSTVASDIRNDIGGALIPMIKTLNAKGKVAEAKKLLEDYGPMYLNAADRSKLMSDSDEANVRNVAINKLAELEKTIQSTNNRPVMISDIEKVKGISEPERFKMIELNEIKNKRNDAERDRKVEILMNTEFERLLKVQSGPDAYINKADYFNSKEFKTTQDQLNSLGAGSATISKFNQLGAIVEAPLKSKPASLEKFNTAYKNNTLPNLTPTEVTEIVQGLSEPDKKNFFNYRNEQKQAAALAERERKAAEKENRPKPVTTQDFSTTSSQMQNIFDDGLATMKYANGDLMFPQNKEGKWKDAQYVNDLINDYRNIMREDLLTYGGKFKTPEEQKMAVDKRLAEVQAKTQELRGNWFSRKWNSSYKSEPRTSAPIITNSPRSSAYGPRTSTPSASPNIPDSLRPNAPIQKPVSATPNIRPSGKVENLPRDSDSKAWMRLYVESTGESVENMTAKKLRDFKNKMKAGQ